MEEKLYGKLNPGVIDSKVDQHYDPDSPRAQSGTAVKEAIETVPELYIDQEFNGESENAQSGIAIQSALDSLEEEIDEKLSTKADQSDLDNLTEIVDDKADKTEVEAMINNVEAEIATKADINQGVENAGKVWKVGNDGDLVLEESEIDVDQHYDPESENAQSGLAVAEAISDIPSTVELVRNSTKYGSRDTIAPALVPA